MANLFETEADIDPNDVGKDPKTEDERYTIEKFKKHLTFKKGILFFINCN